MFKKLKGNFKKTQTDNNKKLIPKINSIEDAIMASKQGMQASIFVASITTIVMLISTNYAPICGLDYTATMDIVVFLIIAFGIKKMSRIASILGLLIYLASQFLMIQYLNGGKFIMVFFIALAYINSIRGTIAYHKYKKQNQQLVA